MLVGHYARITQGQTIDQTIYDRGYTAEQLKALEERYEEQAKGKSIKLVNLEFSGTMDKYCYGLFDYVMTAFTVYDKNGVLPFPGSLSQQPAQIMDIFSVLTQIQFESQMKVQKDHEREMKKLQNRRTGVRS